jgi:nucleoside-diphosphate-sugar epimerase
MKAQRILVTGGAGFIGSHTVDALLADGREVLVLDNLSSGKLENLNLQHPNLEFIEGDVLEYPLIESLLPGCDAILHLAAIASVPLTIAEPIYSMQVNTQGLLHVLQAIKQAQRSTRLVYASSAAVYGETPPPCSDALPVTTPALSPYALQKAHGEDYAGLYDRLHSVKSLGLRYFNVYGLRQDPNSPYSGVISRFLDSYQQDAELTVFGDGKQSRDFIHVSDIAAANLLALDTEFAGVLNVATGRPQTLLELIAAISQAGGRAAKVRFEAARPGDIVYSFGSAEKVKFELGFVAKMNLEQGIKSML